MLCGLAVGFAFSCNANLCTKVKFIVWLLCPGPLADNCSFIGSWQAAGIPPFPPVARIGETTCATTVWTSDSALICSLLEIGRGAGPGVGGLLPVQVELGYQRGVFGQNFGFFAVLFC